MNHFRVDFEYTTVKGNCLTGRCGYVSVETELPIHEMKEEKLKPLCAEFVLSHKPKWNILGLNIKSVSPIVSKKKKPSK